jgi:DNA-binding XRE family transcriptional regulator
MTQEQLAEKAGAHWTTIGKIERGKLIPSIALLSVLAEALDRTVTDLLHLALPELAVTRGSEDEDATLTFVKALPKPERRKLLPVLHALERWKEDG